MLVAYLDESYTEDMFFIGAAIAEEAVWVDVSAKLEAVLQAAIETYELNEKAELHADEIMGGRKHWKPLRGRHREAEEVIKDALKVTRKAGVQYIFRGLDVQRLNARYRYPSPPHEVVLQHLLERLEQHAVFVQASEPIQVIADTVDTKNELQATFAGYKALHTPGCRPSSLSHIASPIAFEDSREHFGLQAIDLAVYLWRRRETVLDPHPRAAATLRRLMTEVDPRAISTSGTWVP